jgi:hypothetical protein
MKTKYFLKITIKSILSRSICKNNRPDCPVLLEWSTEIVYLRGHLQSGTGVHGEEINFLSSLFPVV